ncbi:hypothetical protein BLA29_008306 [Euroglyphus maynei]|uniref:Uncharacterized protein n=1 Tax=Euroglyphus maynei TaxID=6958 RepID=A0A1Y3BM65_EURMA|nr:hypothetical protein BLA29_008306 [Euroglyphus maynei]
MIICFGLINIINGQSDTTGDTVSAIQQCYDSPADLFQVFPQMNGTFKIKIKNKCLQLPELEIYLYIFIKEIDQLDPTKVNSIKINRPTMLFGQTELTNFHPPNARFKFGIVFFDHTGVVNYALHPKFIQINQIHRQLK